MCFFLPLVLWRIVWWWRQHPSVWWGHSLWFSSHRTQQPTEPSVAGKHIVKLQSAIQRPKSVNTCLRKTKTKRLWLPCGSVQKLPSCSAPPSATGGYCCCGAHTSKRRAWRDGWRPAPRPEDSAAAAERSDRKDVLKVTYTSKNMFVTSSAHNLS